MPNVSPIAERYRAFADQQAAGISPTFHAWAHAVAHDPDLLARIETQMGGR